MASTTTASPTLAHTDLEAILGSMYLGGMGAAMLFGVTMLQVYFYFRNYRKDGLFLKFTIFFLWLLDALHMAVTIALIWHTLIYSFGNYLAFDFVTWSYRVQTALEVIVVLSVQSLYTRRVWKLSGNKNYVWPWILIIVLVGGYASGIILVYESFDLVLFSQIQHVRWSIYFCFTMATLNDVMLAIAICHFLYPGTMVFEETKSMACTIIRYVVTSGALTSMCSIAGLITLFVLPNSFVFAGISFVQTKLYINSYLAMLNARKSIRNTAASESAGHIIDLRTSKLEFCVTPSEEIKPEVSGAREREEIRGIIIIGRQHDEGVSYACAP